MDIIKTPVANEIAKEFFIEYTTTTKVSAVLYPGSDFEKNHRSVARYSSIWAKLKYFDYGRDITEKINKKKKRYVQAVKTSRLNLNFYFDYTQKFLGKRRFTSIERKILNYIFSFKEVREIVCKSNGLIEGINAFLGRTFLSKDILDHDLLGIEFIKGFLVNNKRYLKKYEDTTEQFEEFWRVCVYYADKLRNKIITLSNFSNEDYRNLEFNSPLWKYIHINDFHYGDSEKSKQEILKRFLIVFNEDRAPNITPWGSS